MVNMANIILQAGTTFKLPTTHQLTTLNKLTFTEHVKAPPKETTYIKNLGPR
jgi:hypothetical protein